jgi:hypothetical protein
MKHVLKIAAAAAALTIGSALPAMAQITDSLAFTTSFPFYAGNTKMPAGAYRITEAGIDTNELQIQSVSGYSSVFLQFNPTLSAQPHQHSYVTFHRYADVNYLNRISVAGQSYGMKIEPTKAELNSAAATAVTEHAVTEHTISGN